MLFTHFGCFFSCLECTLHTLFAFHHVFDDASSSHEGDADKENSRKKNRRDTKKAVAFLDYR